MSIRALRRPVLVLFLLVGGEPLRAPSRAAPPGGAAIASITILDPDTGLPAREVVVNEGNSVKLRVRVLDTGGVERTDITLLYSSLNPGVATVDAAGNIQGLDAGFSTLAVSSGGVLATGTITVVQLGSGSGGFDIHGIAQDRAGRLFFTSPTGHDILVAQDLQQTPAVYAGQPGTPGFADDTRLQALFDDPAILALNQASGSLYVSDSANHAIRVIRAGPDGRVETLAGTGSAGSQDGPGASAAFRNPQGVALDDRGFLWIADTGNHTIRRINLLTRSVETVAGAPGSPGYVDGSGSAARFSSPRGIALQGESLAEQLDRERRGQPPPPVRLIVADTGNGLLRRISEGGQVETLASTGSDGAFPAPSWARAGQGAAAATVRFTAPTAVAVDAFGNIHVTETSAGRVRSILRNGSIVPATQSGTFRAPSGVVVSRNGSLLVADSSRLAGECSYGEPRIDSILPDNARLAVGETVTVRGRNFAPDTLLVAGGLLLSHAEIVDTQTITFTAPDLPSGRLTLTAQHRGGIAQAAWSLQPTALSSLPTGFVTTVAGGGAYEGDGGAATSAGISRPTALAVDPAGNVYVADTMNHRVRRIRAGAGTITTVAGTGEADFLGDDGPAIVAALDQPIGLALDAAGNLFVSDYRNGRVRRVDAETRVVTTIAGDGSYDFYGDGLPAAQARFAGPGGLALDGSGNLFIADIENQRVRRIDAATGVITTVAGYGVIGDSGDGGPATEAQFRYPYAVAADAPGNLYISDTYNNRVRRVDARTQVITTVAGTGVYGFSGDGGPATLAQLDFPIGLHLDVAGNLYIVDSANSRIRRVDAATGIITTVAGNGQPGDSGDDGRATAAQIGSPWAVVADSAGNLYITDFANNRVRRVSTTGIITAFAGTGQLGTTGDGGAAQASRLGHPAHVAVDAGGNLFIADTAANRIRRVASSTGVITTVAGTGEYGFEGDGGQAAAARLGNPHGIAVDGSGNLYVADRDNHRLRKVEAATGIITTLVGTGAAAGGGDGGPGTSAGLSFPRAVAVDPKGNLFIADSFNDRIRKLNGATGVVTTVAGDGAYGYTGDGVAATATSLGNPQSVALDRQGNLYIADTENHRIRKVNAATGIITTIAGTGRSGHAGDGGPAVSALLSYPRDVLVDASGDVFVADTDNQAIRRIQVATGIIETIAGTGSAGLGGDGGRALEASLANPKGIALDRAGNLYVADTNNNRIRAVKGPAGASCAYVLAPSSRSFGSAGGASLVGVQTMPACLWAATARDAWITITSGSSSPGNGLVAFFVAGNASPIGRQGTLTVAGKTFTATQAGTDGSFFSDVPPGYWAFNTIAAIYGARITTGCGGGRYCPESVASREQAAAFVIRALEGDRSSSYCNSGAPFTDVARSGVFCGDIKRLAELQITKASGAFNPKAPISRGEAAAFIIRALFGESFSFPSVPYFADVPPTHGFFKYVQKLKEKGITQTTGRYSVDGTLTRAELAAFFARAFVTAPASPAR